MRIYLASSWRNKSYPSVLAALRAVGHHVYDWRESVEVTDFGLEAHEAFERDMRFLVAADAVVLLLPAGRSAHLEAGYAAALEKPLLIVDPAYDMTEVMYLMASAYVKDTESLIKELAAL